MAVYEVFRSGWPQAKISLAKDVYSGEIPESDERILENWYKIRRLYLLDRNIEQFINQGREFDKEYDKFLDRNSQLIKALSTISNSMNWDFK